MILYDSYVSGSLTVASGITGSFTGSLLGTAATASYADNFTVGGTLTAQIINVQTITSSIEFITGSTRNGSLSSNTHQFTGSVSITGSAAALLNVSNGVLYVSASGNVGINNISPTVALDVTGAGKFSGVATAKSFSVVGTNGYSGQIIQQGDIFGSAATNLLIQSSTSNGIGFLTNGGTTFNMFINSTGSVLIGTTTDSGYKLDVSGTARVSGAATFSSGQTGGYVTSTSGYVNETKTVSTNATSYYLIKYTGTSNGSSTTTFDITGMSTTNGTYADIYAIAQKDATANAINTNVGVYINGQSMNLPTIQAGGTAANTVRCSFRVCRMEGTWVIIGNPNTSYF